MEYELGTIRVEAEILEENPIKITDFNDLLSRYRELGKNTSESLYAVYLDQDNCRIGDQRIGKGDHKSVAFNFTEILRTAALVNAAGTIIVHNHPSGNPAPTSKDIKTTEELHQALDQIGVELLDHVIIARNNELSMRGNQDGPFTNTEKTTT